LDNSQPAFFGNQPTNLSGNGNPVGTITVTLADGSSWITDSNGSLISGSIKSISLGSSYDNAYLVMTVSPSGCAPNYEVDPTQPLSAMKCIAAGTTVTSSNGSLQNSSWYNLMDSFSSPVCKSYSWFGCSSYAYTINPIGSAWTFSTNNTTQTNQLFVSQSAIPQPPTSAVQLPLGVLPSIQTLIPCGQTTYWAIEDTPWKTAGLADGAWQSQDFFFTIQGVTCSTSTAGANALPHLTR